MCVRKEGECTRERERETSDSDQLKVVLRDSGVLLSLQHNAEGLVHNGIVYDAVDTSVGTPNRSNVWITCVSSRNAIGVKLVF